MNQKYLAFVLLISLGFFSTAHAKDLTGKESVLCAMTEVYECVRISGCERVAPQEVGLQTIFLAVDFKKREIRAKGADQVTVADRLFEVGDKLVLAGAEATDWVEGRAVGYSLTVTRATGEMVLSSAGDDVAFVVFGNCTNQ